MRKQRVRQLKTANEEEDKVIRKLEKQLKIDKTRSDKYVPKMFNDGLEYALELCLPENIQKMYTAAKEAAQSDSDDGFDEDLQIATGLSGTTNDVLVTKKSKKSTTHGIEKANDGDQRKIDKRMAKLRKVEGKFFDDLDSDLSGVDSEFGVSDEEMEDASDASEEGDDFGLMDSADEDSAAEGEQSEEVSSDDAPEERPIKKSAKSTNKKKKVEVSDEDFESSQSDSESDQESVEQAGKFVRKPPSDSDSSELDDSFPEDGMDDMDLEGSDSEGETETANDSKTWEDIYGRKRDKDGNVIGTETSTQDGKYIPPHVRARLAAESGEDPKKAEKLNRLKKQLKGWLNRLSEANIYKIVTDIDNLYMQNPRHDMNITLTSLMFDSLISNVLAPERMVLEHMLLIAALHGNVGSEVGEFENENPSSSLCSTNLNFSFYTRCTFPTINDRKIQHHVVEPSSLRC